MNVFFWVSYITLWLLVVPLVVLNLVLFRQLGIVVMGTARGVNQSGIPAGRRLPKVGSVTIQGQDWSTESVKGRPHLLIFGSPTCKECSAIMPDLERMRQTFGVEPILLMFADMEQSTRYVQRHQLNVEVVLASQEVGSKLDVEVTPFGYGVDSQGIIRAKSLINSRTHLEVLARAALGDSAAGDSRTIIAAKEMDSAQTSIEETVPYN